MAQQINLFDSALQKKRDWFALVNIVLATAILMVLVAVTGLLVRLDIPALQTKVDASASQLKTMRDQVLVLGQRVANSKPDPRLEEELASMRQRVAVRQEILEALRQRMGPEADSFGEYLRGFSRQAVAGLWLTGFSFDAHGGGRMEISGRTTDAALVPEYIGRLNKEAAFKGRAFSSLKLAKGRIESAEAAPAGKSATAKDKKAPYLEFVLMPVVVQGKPTEKTAGGQR